MISTSPYPTDLLNNLELRHNGSDMEDESAYDYDFELNFDWADHSSPSSIPSIVPDSLDDPELSSAQKINTPMVFASPIDATPHQSC